MPDSPGAARPVAPLVLRLFAAARVTPLVRDRWLGAGFEPTQALHFVSTGASLDEAVEARRSGLGALDVWRRGRAAADPTESIAHLVEVRPGSGGGATVIYRTLTDRSETARIVGTTADLAGALDTVLTVLGPAPGLSGARTLTVNGFDGATVLALLNRSSLAELLDHDIEIHIETWETCRVADDLGKVWLLPLGHDSEDGLVDHGGDLFSFDDVYFAQTGLDFLPRALGRHGSWLTAREVLRSGEPLVQVTPAWSDHDPRATGPVWEVRTDGDRFAVSDGSSHARLDEALAAVGRALFPVRGSLLVRLPEGSTLDTADLVALVPVDREDFTYHRVDEPALIINGWDHLAIVPDNDDGVVLLPVQRDLFGSVDLHSAVGNRLAFLAETHAPSPYANEHSLGVIGPLAVTVDARHRNEPEVRVTPWGGDRAQLVASWVQRLGASDLAFAALAAEGYAEMTMTSGDGTALDGQPLTLTSWFDSDLEGDERAAVLIALQLAQVRDAESAPQASPEPV
ncbi:MAG: hypothetical protein F2873_10080 [Actinobacteria bacterium]|uniref:Unannotated protein n=1 Tax=freshwater metagenome TaxID=449393 RepID=A0A6J6X834_9ZZZZ|nr:hypothetical protein [Actinomycetota bacterium]MSX78749.1 hypothetical protein [Actinomycetota bacterium]